MTNPTMNKSGSLWRRWDLHIHTPGTKLSNGYGDPTDEIWNRYVDELEASPVQVFGITDYFSCDRYFEFIQRFRDRKPDSVKQFFPNLEFRLAESISADDGHADFHIIFDNDPDVCSPEKLTTFLTDLQTQQIDDVNVKPRCIDLQTEADFAAATVSLDSLLEALTRSFGDARPYLLAFPANNNGLRSVDKLSPRKVQLADRLDRSCDLFFGNQGNVEYLLKLDRYEDGSSEPKPVVSGSDAHSFDDLERLSGDVSGYPPTWIKADTTFIGLKQILYEPKFRVHIGQEPAVVTRQEQDGTKFLSQLKINQVDGYDERNGEWFKGVNLPLNPELTVVIGNKGSGKSAIVDIIGLLGESRQEDHFSFLKDDPKSKKFRQRGFAENFTASVSWLSSREDEKLLSDNADTDKPETVRYLPQNYFEQLTNEIEIEQFRREIEDVVFSHVEETERLGKSSFSELEETRTLQSKHEISELKKQLRELQVEIVRLEEQSSPQYRKQLQAQIEGKEQQLAAIEKVRPAEVLKPDTETKEQRQLDAEVTRLSTLLADLQERGRRTVEKISALKVKLQDAVSLRESLAGLETGFSGSVDELQEKLTSLGLNAEQVIRLKINFEPLDSKVGELTDEIANFERENVLELTDKTDFLKIATLPDLRTAFSFVKTQIDERKEQLSTPQRRYQGYQEKLKEWRDKREEIEGSEENPKPDTLNWLRKNLKHLDEEVAALLQNRLTDRANLVSRIFESKNHVLNFYSDLKSSVEERLQLVRTHEFAIEIDASFIVDPSFRRDFIHHINRQKRGPYRVEQDALRELTQAIESTDWNDANSIIKFCNGLVSKMRDYNGETLSVVDQVRDVKQFYDFLFSLDYLSPKYELRLGGKNLNELSPGEKGLLLLIFYLQLDRNNTPLVIDQPEDNLDNDSIFKVLANCIREAKKHRQVILVTHNPNLAVGADAEQIIHVSLEKPKNYKFSYESGSIENPRINKRIVTILEGSQPAFVKRRLKYGL